MNARWASGLALVLVLACLGPAADAAPACGSSITHSIHLHGDIGSSGVPCSGDGLVINRSGVTVDLGGHYIWGAAGGDGIHLLAKVQGVTIENGTIRGFSSGNGIHSDMGNGGLTIRHVVLAGNFRGTLLDGNHITVVHNIVTNHPDQGIGITGSHALVTNNVVTRNVNGIAVGKAGTVSHNVVAGNTGFGIETLGGMVSGNTVTGSGDTAISFSGRVSVVGNKVISNVQDGINGNGDGSSFVRNKVIGNGGYGIDVDSLKAVYDRNVVDGNGSDGMFMFGNASVITHNVVRGSGFWGMNVSGSNVQILHNKVIGSDHDGIHWAVGGGVAKGNLLVGNGFGTGSANGIRAGIDSTGATVTGSNIAEANDQRDCIPVALCHHPGTNIANVQALPCGSHVTASVKLSADVGSTGSPCSGKGLIVDNPNVTIDLNGFTIYGDGSSAPSGDLNAGIFIGDKVGVHVLNGRVLGFQVGIFKGTLGFESGQGLGPHIEGLVMQNSSDDVLLDGSDLLVNDNAFVGTPNFEASNTTGTGVVEENVSVGNFRGFHVSFHVLVARNVSRYDKGVGVITVTAPVRSNVVVHSAGASGIDGFDGPITGNEVVASGYPATGPSVSSHGIASSGDSAVTNNIVGGSTADGLSLTGGHASATGDLLVANGAAGGEFTGSHATITGNRSFGNGTHGILSNGSFAHMTGNRILGNNNDGIDALQFSLVESENVTSANGDAGIVNGTGTTGLVAKNVANGNGYRVVNGNCLGILNGGGEHGDQNHATGNDDPLQCGPTTIC